MQRETYQQDLERLRESTRAVEKEKERLEHQKKIKRKTIEVGHPCWWPHMATCTVVIVMMYYGLTRVACIWFEAFNFFVLAFARWFISVSVCPFSLHHFEVETWRSCHRTLFLVAYRVSYEWEKHQCHRRADVTLTVENTPLCASSPYPPAALVFAYASSPYATMSCIVSFMGEQFWERATDCNFMPDANKSVKELLNISL